MKSPTLRIFPNRLSTTSKISIRHFAHQQSQKLDYATHRRNVKRIYDSSQRVPLITIKRQFYDRKPNSIDASTQQIRPGKRVYTSQERRSFGAGAGLRPQSRSALKAFPDRKMTTFDKANADFVGNNGKKVFVDHQKSLHYHRCRHFYLHPGV
jgi:hypothetical protein